MQVKSIRNLVEDVSETVPGTAIATVGLGLAFYAYEVHRMSTFQGMYVDGVTSPITTLFVVAIVLALAAVYRHNPRFRLHRSPVVGFCISGFLTLAMLVATGSMSISLVQDAAFIIKIVVRTLEILLFLCWFEVLSTLPVRRCATIVALAIVFLALMIGISAFFKDGAVFILLSLFPMFSMACLYWFKDRHETFGKSAMPDGQVEDNRLGATLTPLFDTSLWPKNSTVRSRIIAALSYVIPLFGYTFLFGYIHFIWVPNESGEQWSTVIQLGNAIGTLFAGWVLLALTTHYWGRRQLILYNLFILPVLIAVLYLTSLVDGSDAFFFVIPLYMCQNVVLFLAMLAPFFIVSGASCFSVWCVVFSTYTLAKGLSGFFYAIFDPSAYTSLALSVGAVLIIVVIVSIVFNDNRMTDSETGEASDDSAQTDAARSGEDKVVFSDGSDGEGAHTEAAIAETISGISRDFRLTKREEEIFTLLSQGMTASTIAEELVVSTATIKTHMRNLYAKLGIHSQNELLLMVHRGE